MTDQDRMSHMHVVGGSGTGKSNFVFNLISQDIANGNGLCLVDPHGELYEMTLNWLAANKSIYKRRKIHIIDITEPRVIAAFNPIANNGNDLSVVASNNMEAISTAWNEDSNRTPQLREVLQQTFISLASQNMTYIDAPLFLYTKHRNKRRMLTGLPNADYWDDLDRLSDKAFKEETNSARRRMNELIKNELLKLMIGQSDDVIDLYECMERGDIILMNLAKGVRFSSAQSRFLGSIFINNMISATYQRKAGKASPYYLYIDEAQNLLSDDIPEILTECRKFGLRMILANQDLGQLRAAGEVLYKGVMGSAQTKAYFGALDFDDADILAKNIFKKIDFKEVKHTLSSPSVVGHRIQEFKNRSQSNSNSSGQSQAHGSSKAVSHSKAKTISKGAGSGSNSAESNSDTTSSGTTFLPVDDDIFSLIPDEAIESRTSESTASNTGASQSNSNSQFSSDSNSSSESQSEATNQISTHNRNQSTGESEGYSEGLVPIIKERISSQTFYSLNEQDRKNIEKLRTLGLGEFYFSSFARTDPVKVKANYNPPSERKNDLRELKLYCAKQSYFVKSSSYAASKINNRVTDFIIGHSQELTDDDFLE